MSCTRVFIPYQMQIVSCKLLLLGLLNPQPLSLDHQPVPYLKFKYCSSLNYCCPGNVQINPVMKVTHLQLSAKLKYGNTVHSPYPLGCHEYLQLYSSCFQWLYFYCLADHSYQQNICFRQNAVALPKLPFNFLGRLCLVFSSKDFTDYRIKQRLV